MPNSMMRGVPEIPSSEDKFIRTLYFGGGTPSALSEKSLRKIFKSFSSGLGLRLLEEATFELNPEDVHEQYLRFLSEEGINRISLGVQSMSERAQQVLKRCSSGDNESALISAGRVFDNINVDILAGIPGGSVKEIHETLDRVLLYEPSHISVYLLEEGADVNAGTREFFSSVDDEQSAIEYMHVCEVLNRRGYEHYEVSNFSLPGKESRHNRVYWDKEDYIGIGPGAHSCVSGIRTANAPSLEEYINGPRHEFDCKENFNRPARESSGLEELMLGLRTNRGIALESLHGADSIIKDLEAGGLAKTAHGRLSLSDRGYLLLNEIILRLSSRLLDGSE